MRVMVLPSGMARWSPALTVGTRLLSVTLIWMVVRTMGLPDPSETAPLDIAKAGEPPAAPCCVRFRAAEMVSPTAVLSETSAKAVVAFPEDPRITRPE